MTTEGLTFIREIPADRITDAVLADYEKRGFILVWKEDSVEIWCK